MNNTTNIPHFVMETSNYGSIVVNNVYSEKLFSKEEALGTLSIIAKQRAITPAEQNKVEQEIAASPLPERLSIETKLLFEMKDILGDIHEILDQEFGGMPRDSFNSKNEPAEDGSTYIPGNQTRH